MLGWGAPSHNAYPHKRGNWVRTWEVNTKKTIKSILEVSMYKTLTTQQLLNMGAMIILTTEMMWILPSVTAQNSLCCGPHFCKRGRLPQRIAKELGGLQCWARPPHSFVCSALLRLILLAAKQRNSFKLSNEFAEELDYTGERRTAMVLEQTGPWKVVPRPRKSHNPIGTHFFVSFGARTTPRFSLCIHFASILWFRPIFLCFSTQVFKSHPSPLQAHRLTCISVPEHRGLNNALSMLFQCLDAQTLQMIPYLEK